jgi:hypothetical protein
VAQHKKNRNNTRFLDEVADGFAHDEAVAWFTRLPLWFDSGPRHSRLLGPVVTSVLSPHLPTTTMSEDGPRAAAYKGTAEFDAVEMVQGPEVPLPSEFGYLTTAPA